MICHNGANYVRTELEKAAGTGALIETNGGLVLCCENETEAARRAAAERVGEAFVVPVARRVPAPPAQKRQGIVDRVALFALWEEGALKGNAVALSAGKGALSAACTELEELWEETLLVSGFGDDSHFFVPAAGIPWPPSTSPAQSRSASASGRMLRSLRPIPRLDMAAFVEQKRRSGSSRSFCTKSDELLKRKSAVIAIDGRCRLKTSPSLLLLQQRYGWAGFCIWTISSFPGNSARKNGSAARRHRGIRAGKRSCSAHTRRGNRFVPAILSAVRGIRRTANAFCGRCSSSKGRIPAILPRGSTMTWPFFLGRERERAGPPRPPENGEGADCFFDSRILPENAYFAALRGTFRFGLAL